MSYSGSQQQYGLSDLQLLQQHIMLAQLQELQKQKQLGQQSSVNNPSLFSKQASGGQIQNFNSGIPLNASQMFAASNMNWMQRTVSSPMQNNSSSSSYSRDQGIMMNPAMQQPDIAFYGTPVASGRGNLGQYSPLRGVSHSYNMLSLNSEQKSLPQVSPFSNFFLHDKRSIPAAHAHSLDGSFMAGQGLQGRGSVEQGPVPMLNSGVSLRNVAQPKTLVKDMSLVEHHRTPGQHGCPGFLQEQTKQTNDSQETAKLDPLEEKILFETEDSVWDTSFSKLAAMSADEVVSTSAPTEYVSTFPSIQSGSWSALMHSAVAEASSSETGIQEELSGLSFQNTELSTDNQPSNFVTSDQQHVTLSTDSKLHSSSYNMSAPPSSCDSIMSSALPSFHQTGLTLASAQGVNKMASDKSIKYQPKYLSPLSESQLRLKQSDPVRQLGNSWLCQNDQHLKGNAQMQISSLNQSHRPIDVFQGSVSSSLLMSGMNKNNVEAIQQETAADAYMAITDVTVDQKDNESIGYSGHQLSNSPAVIGASNKTAAEMYEIQDCYRGENSSDSYNSKLSQAYTPQPDHACLNAEDSESSARSSHKSPNQALCMSSPGASNQQECFSSLKSANALCTNTNYMTKVNPNLSANALSKGSPASDVSASLDSQYTSELNKANPPRNYGNTTRFGAVVSQSEFHELSNVSISEGMPIPDKFSFQSSVAENLRQFSLGNGQKGQIWWMPPSFSHSGPPSSGPSGPSLAQNCSGKSSILRNSFQNSVFNSEISSHEAVFSGPLYVKSQLEGQDMFNAPSASENVQKRYPEMGQDMSMTGSPHNTYPLKNVSSSGFQYSTGASPVKQSFISSTYQQGINPLNVWMGMSSQRYRLGDQSKVSSNSSATPSGLHGIDQSSLVGLLSRNKQITVGRDQKLANESCHEPKPPSIEASGVHESVCKSPLLSGYASYFSGSRNQQGCIGTVLTNRSSAGISSGVLQTSGQIQHAHNCIVENIKHELHSSVSTNNADSDIAKENFSSSAAGVPAQKQLHEVHNYASYPGAGQSSAARQLNLCHSGDPNIVASSSGTSTRPFEIVTSLSALQYIQASKVPMFGSTNPQGHSSGNNMVSDRIRNLGIRPQMAPAWYKQYDYIKNGQMLSLSDSAVLYSVKPYQTVQLTGTGTHVNEFYGSKDCGSVLIAHNQIVNEQLLVSSVLPVDSVNIKLPPSKPKKRKAAMYDYLPWHKEVVQTCKELPEISITEEAWAEASIRLTENSVDWGEQSELIQPAARAKRRLILTTQLMQQVFQPPPPNILSVDAATEYEIMGYFVAKLTLADACCMTNKAKTDCHILPENRNIDAVRPRNIWSNGHPSLAKDIEELVDKAKRLESYINGLDRSVSVVDVRVECQELEKFCLINHFAKYHSRVVQLTGTDSASSSTTMSSMRPFLQRYVSAAPLPQNLPEGSQCLSL